MSVIKPRHGALLTSSQRTMTHNKVALFGVQSNRKNGNKPMKELDYSDVPTQNHTFDALMKKYFYNDRKFLLKGRIPAYDGMFGVGEYLEMFIAGGQEPLVTFVPNTTMDKARMLTMFSKTPEEYTHEESTMMKEIRSGILLALWRPKNQMKFGAAMKIDSTDTLFNRVLQSKEFKSMYLSVGIECLLENGFFDDLTKRFFKMKR